ncbi:MAG: hypothetical protein CVV27_18215, partial [Candidatus Melainabacteria bacterium HGW-Melainabacteria-1]
PICKGPPKPGYENACEVAFKAVRHVSNPQSYPENDDTQQLDLSPEKVKDFLNTYVQVDRGDIQDPALLARAKRQCATACVIAAYLQGEGLQGLSDLTSITQTKLMALAKQRGGIPQDIRPILEGSRPFLQGLQKRIEANQVTRGDIERLQDILSTLMNEGERKSEEDLQAETERTGKPAVSGHIDHGVSFNTVNSFFEGTNFHEMLAKHDLEIMGMSEHAVLKIKGREIFDPFPREAGQQITSNIWEISRYNQSQTQEMEMHGIGFSSIK